MKTFLAIIGFCVLFLFVAGTCAFCNDDDKNSLGKIQLAYYDEQPRCYDDGYCDDGGDGYDQRYDQNYGSRDDRNRNRGRNRGSFSPGPFDRSPLDFRNACISLDCSGRGNDDRRDQPPPDEGERS